MFTESWMNASKERPCQRDEDGWISGIKAGNSIAAPTVID